MTQVINQEGVLVDALGICWRHQKDELLSRKDIIILLKKLLTTSHLDDNKTTGLKHEMLQVIKTGNGITHDEKLYAALRRAIHGEKTTPLNRDD